MTAAGSSHPARSALTQKGGPSPLLPDLYIEYMIGQGYKKVQFTMQPDGQYAMQACYKYNGKVYLATKTADAVLVSLDLTVASELEFWGQNGSGSGSAIKETDCYIKVSGLVFSK